MTANPRRTGFRMPWTSDDDVPQEEGAPAEAPAGPEGSADRPQHDPAVEPAAPPTELASDLPNAVDEPPDDFMRGLVAAMRTVADEAKESGLVDLRARAAERIRELEAEAEQRRQDLARRADVDVAAVGEWARAEAERIKAEAERRVSARQVQLEEQLAADATRADRETKGVREVVTNYERELEAYHAQLAEISDPAAFAAAAKRMPRPPVLRAATSDAQATPDAPQPAGSAAAQPLDGPSAQASTNGLGPAGPDVHPAEEEVLAARLAELDSTMPADSTSPPSSTAAAPATTEVVVTGLGSFGAITSFRQSLANVDGVEGVALSLGSSGEFIFRATHHAGFDIRDAITALEGDAASVRPRDEGGYLVTLERAR